MRKIIILTLTFFSGITTIFAFDASISLDKNNIDVNNSVILKLEITDIGEGEKIGISNIGGIENFDIVSTSQSQNFVSKRIVINGKVQSQTKQIFAVNFVLKPKNSGNFEIGPIELSDGKNTTKTNSLDLEVSGQKVVSLKDNISNSLKFSEQKQKIDEKKDKEETKNLKDIFSLENIIKMVVVSLIIFAILFVIIISRNNKKSEDDDENCEEDEEDFEKIEEVNIPKIDNENFIKNAENYTKYKFQTKYNFKNLDLKNILKNEEIKDEDREILEKIIKKLDIMKYSNLLNSKTELLEIIQKL